MENYFQTFLIYVNKIAFELGIDRLEHVYALFFIRVQTNQV